MITSQLSISEWMSSVTFRRAVVLQWLNWNPAWISNKIKMFLKFICLYFQNIHFIEIHHTNHSYGTISCPLKKCFKAWCFDHIILKIYNYTNGTIQAANIHVQQFSSTKVKNGPVHLAERVEKLPGWKGLYYSVDEHFEALAWYKYLKLMTMAHLRFYNAIHKYQVISPMT